MFLTCDIVYFHILEEIFRREQCGNVRIGLVGVLYHRK